MLWKIFIKGSYLRKSLKSRYSPVSSQSIVGAEATIAGVELWQMLRHGQMENAGGMCLWEHLYSLAV